MSYITESWNVETVAEKGMVVGDQTSRISVASGRLRPENRDTDLRAMRNPHEWRFTRMPECKFGGSANSYAVLCRGVSMGVAA